MPRKRFLKLDAARQRAILDAARSEFAQNGFEGASYNQIIEGAGLSKGAMYYYFEDKLDLYVTVLEEVTAQALEHLGVDDVWTLEEDFWTAFTDMVRGAWTYALANPEMAALVKGMQAFPPKMRKEGRLADVWGTWEALMVRMLREGQRKGEVRQDLSLELLAAIGIAIDEAVDFWLIDNMAELAENPVEEVVGMIIDLWKRVLKP